MLAGALIAAVLTGAPQAQACAFHDERGTIAHSPNPTPAFEAAGKPWYENGDKIAYAGGSYAKYGLPRQLSPEEIEAIDDRNGVPLFVEAGSVSDKPDVVYVMVRSLGCVFQPYGRE